MIRLNLRFVFWAIFFLGILFSCQGLPIFGAVDEPIDLDMYVEDTVRTVVGEMRVFAVTKPTRVIIGNPQIADISDVSDTEITVSAKSAGVTTLSFWDVFGEHSIKIRVIAEDMSEIKRRADNVLATLGIPGVYTRASDDENKVLVLGSVKDSEDKDKITNALNTTLKEKILNLVALREEEAVVEIDVQVLELDKDATKQLGFSWPGNLTITEQAVTPTRLSSVFVLQNFTRNSLQMSIDALVQEGKARILSRPRLACQSGKNAELLVGGEKPILTTQAVSGGGASTQVEYKEFGIKLNIKPTVKDDDRIKLSLKVEVSDVGDVETLGSANAPTAKAFPLVKRTSSTELYLNDGQTMAIGGLIKKKTEEDLRKFPWLGDVPVLGTFFKYKVSKVGGGSGSRGDVELFITLTPTIVSREKKPDFQRSALKEQKSVGTALELANYVRAVQTKITDAVYYPKQAKDAGWEGKLKLGLNLAANGNLKASRIMESSGFKLLDDVALDSARRLSPYPPFPPQIKDQELWVDVPIVFKKD
jgi:pilus assembly protein CpaC